MVDSPSGVGSRIGPPPSATPNARAPVRAAAESENSTESPAPPTVTTRQAAAPTEPLLASGETPLRGSLVDILV